MWLTEIDRNSPSLNYTAVTNVKFYDTYSDTTPDSGAEQQLVSTYSSIKRISDKRQVEQAQAQPEVNTKATKKRFPTEW